MDEYFFGVRNSTRDDICGEVNGPSLGRCFPICLFVALCALNCSCKPGGAFLRQKYEAQHEDYAVRFKRGDPNVPLLAMDWFSEAVHFCRVNQQGHGSFRRDTGRSIRGGGRISMDSTNLHVLIRTLDSLPSPPSHRVPVDRRLVLGCIRSNQWFRGVYDRADLPRQLEVVAEITGADLPWSIPNAYGQLRAHVGGQESFRAVASDVPIAASIEYAYQPDLQIWNLKNGGRLGRPFKLPPQSSSYKQGFVLSYTGPLTGNTALLISTPTRDQYSFMTRLHGSR